MPKEIISIKKSEARYQSLIEASRDPLVSINSDGKITEMNEALVVITGLSRKKLLGSDFFDYFTEKEKARDVYREVFAKGFIANSPLTLKHKKGKLTDVLFNGSVYKDAEGIVVGVVVVARDIAEQKWATELRIANKELAFQNIEKGKRADELGIANKELAFQNDEKEKRADELEIAIKELAFQNDEKEKRADELGIANEELAFQNKEKEKRAEELRIANKELAFQNKEKEKRAEELETANKKLAFQNNEKEKRSEELKILIEQLAFQNDEKEKRANELRILNEELAFQNKEKENRAEELRIANKELAYQNDEKEKRAEELRIANYARGLIEASLDPLVTINIEGKITDMNQATVNVIGMSRENLTGTDFFDYFTDPQKAREVYEATFANGSVADSPLTLRHRDGKLTDVLFNGSVYKDDRGNVLGVVVVARDITDQKRFENELIEAKGKAENATIIAQSAVKAKQQFLSNMSHEIRTPMNAIIGFTKVVLNTGLTDKQKEYLNAIKTSGDALIVLINDILDLAKVDAGKMTFEYTPFKLGASISAMVHLFETKILEKNLELVQEYDENIPEVLMGDSVRLHQVILNLVSNAVKFTSEGQITVSVKLLEEDNEKVILEFAVKDTGIGIPEDKLENIFDDFQQASSGTSRIYGGTGLGLAIVKSLIEPQGGKITVKSKIGEGSTFSFTLSFNKTLQNADIEADVVLEPQQRIKNIKLLVVEDIALNQLLMRTIIEDFGFEMDIAGNGKIAIQKLSESNYDLILMDLQMPVMNGLEATEHIRQEMKIQVPIIALTADVTTVDVEKCRAAGMNDYISKPVDDRLLYSKINKYVTKREPLTNADNTETNHTGNGLGQHEKCINLDYLKKLTKSHDRMVEMIDIYLVEIPQLINTMRDGIDKSNWHSLKIASHSIIPTFLIMGIDSQYSSMAKQIYDQATQFCDSNDFEGTSLSGIKRRENAKVILRQLFLKIEETCNYACEDLKKELLILNEGMVSPVEGYI